MNQKLIDFIALGEMRQVFSIFGHDVELKLLDGEEDAAVQKEVSGYDLFTREILTELSILKRALISIDSINFSTEADAYNFVKQLQPPVRLAIIEKYKSMRDLQMMNLEGLRIELKEVAEQPFLGGSGSSTKQPVKKKK